MIYPTQHSIAELFNCSLFKVLVRMSWKDLLTPNTKKRDRTVREQTIPASNCEAILCLGSVQQLPTSSLKSCKHPFFYPELIAQSPLRSGLTAGPHLPCLMGPYVNLWPYKSRKFQWEIRKYFAPWLIYRKVFLDNFQWQRKGNVCVPQRPLYSESWREVCVTPYDNNENAHLHCVWWSIIHWELTNFTP